MLGMYFRSIHIKLIACFSLQMAGLGTTVAANYTLEDLILQSMNSYPSISAKMASKEAAESDLLASKLKFLPSPSISTQQNKLSTSGTTANSPATTIGISQPIFAGGGILAGYKKADSRNSAADYALLETREDVAKRMINVYVEWEKAYTKILALEQNVRLHEKFAGMIIRRSEGGVASESDQNLGSSRLAQARADLDTQRSIEKTALTSISELVGMPITRADLIKNMAKPVVVPKRAVGIQEALAASPTIQKYTHESDAAESEAKEVRAQTMPQVNFQAQRQNGNPYVPGAQGYDLVGLVVQFTPGNGFSTIPSSSAAFGRAKAASMQIETSKRDITDRLNADYNEHEFSSLKIENLRRSVGLTEDISASYDRQYLVGKKSWLDLMNAVREQVQTKVALADAEGSLIASSRRIWISIRGTNDLNSTPAPPIREARRSLTSDDSTGGAQISPVTVSSTILASKLASTTASGAKPGVVNTYSPVIYNADRARAQKDTSLNASPVSKSTSKPGSITSAKAKTGRGDLSRDRNASKKTGSKAVAKSAQSKESTAAKKVTSNKPTKAEVKKAPTQKNTSEKTKEKTKEKKVADKRDEKKSHGSKEINKL